MIESIRARAQRLAAEAQARAGAGSGPRHRPAAYALMKDEHVRGLAANGDRHARAEAARRETFRAETVKRANASADKARLDLCGDALCDYPELRAWAMNQCRLARWLPGSDAFLAQRSDVCPRTDEEIRSACRAYLATFGKAEAPAPKPRAKAVTIDARAIYRERNAPRKTTPAAPPPARSATRPPSLADLAREVYGMPAAADDGLIQTSGRAGGAR